MRVTDILRDIGHPVAYYPGLSRYLGGVKATAYKTIPSQQNTY